MNFTQALGFDPAALVGRFVRSGKIRFEAPLLTPPTARPRALSRNAQSERRRRARFRALGLTSKGKPRTGLAKTFSPALKEWFIDEAQRLGITPHAVYMRVKRGKATPPKGLRP